MLWARSTRLPTRARRRPGENPGLEAAQISDDAIHGARKELKKARSALRLLRDALQPAQYRRWNTDLRDAARPLSAARDARVLLDTLQQLLSSCGRSCQETADGLIRLLQREHLKAGRGVRNTSKEIQRSRALLRGVLRRIERTTVRAEGWAPPGKGLHRVYSDGRRAMRTAQARDPDALHDWRKQTKYLWHQLQILEPLWPEPIGELANQAHRLSNYLGDDHDLSVLRTRIAHSGSAEADAGSKALLALIERRQDELRETAFLLGLRFYAEKPKAFAARFGGYREHSQRRASNAA